VSLIKRLQACKSGGDWLAGIATLIRRDTLALGVAGSGEELVDVIVDAPSMLVPVGGGADVADVCQETVAAIKAGFAQATIQQLARRANEWAVLGGLALAGSFPDEPDR
jgi:hypothetical protein